MPVENPFTDSDKILSVVGRLGLGLRLEDAADQDAVLDDVIDEATGEIYFYLMRYAPADIAANNWAVWHATWFAVRALCRRRLNDVPKSVEEEWARRQKQLELVQQNKARAPGLANSRRPAAVTSYHVDLRRFNNQVRVDKARSTGRAEGYIRPVDNAAPDDRT
jgi:hypothetical protein